MSLLYLRYPHLPTGVGLISLPIVISFSGKHENAQERPVAKNGYPEGKFSPTGDTLLLLPIAGQDAQKIRLRNQRRRVSDSFSSEASQTAEEGSYALSATGWQGVLLTNK